MTDHRSSEMLAGSPALGSQPLITKPKETISSSLVIELIFMIIGG
jgi:hypothetical protein